MNLENIQLKALNPDNDCQILQVVRLFERIYNRSFPIATVYDQKFWKTHAGSRFTSLIATDDLKVIAHMAIRPDRDNPRHVQIYLPVCDPHYLSIHEKLHNELAAFIETQSRRHGWNMLYYHVVGELPEMQFFAQEVFKTQEVAVWPFCLPACPNGNGRKHVLVTQRMIAPQQADRAQPNALCSEELFVPAWHSKICTYLYDALGLNGRFHGGRRTSDSGRQALSADRRALETRSYRRTGVVLNSIEPSLVTNRKNCLRALSGQQYPWQYVALNLRDAKTPSFCEALEEHGYRFCGTLPVHGGKHTLLYYNARKVSFTQSDLRIPTSVLGRYMENYNFSEVEKFLSSEHNARI